MKKLVLIVLFAFAVDSLHASEGDLRARIRQMLDLYASKDVSGLTGSLADEDILLMGSDLREVCTTREQVGRLLQQDFSQWDSASFGPVGAIFSRNSGDLVTAFFDVPFTFHKGLHGQTVALRFATVWRKTSEGLKLVQIMNAVPTGQSSANAAPIPEH
ncbi:MAG: nuclear transport factor 2 family protein [Acidobacteriota bacterium]|nr:nuclear transport factor 2 family protein [Acidobacteriota bacterium]MDE3163344.1 nuclear transport factor 2 family protein [Acidobacteriota bacterium]